MTGPGDSRSVQPAVSVQQPEPRSVVTAPEDDRVARLRAGDPQALDQLARSETPHVTRLLFSMLGPRNDLEDLVQTVFLEACRAMPGYRGEGSVTSFILGIAVRVARRAMRPSAWVRLRGYALSEPAGGDDPERATYQAAQLRRLHAALGRLAPKKRVAFTLWAMEGMEVAAIAEVTQASVSATKSRIFHAQKELKRMAARDPHLCELIGGGHEPG